MNDSVNYLPAAITSLVEKTFNRYIGLSSTAKREMAGLEGKSIQVIVRELNLAIIFIVEQNNFLIGNEAQEKIDCTISATILALLRLAVTDDGDESTFGRDFEMSGDMDTGKQFYEILKKVDVDWEEILSKYTGDVVAHKVGNGARALTKWGKETVDRLGRDLTEYLQEESRQLPTQTEIDDYIQQVDEVRLAVDRMEARVKKLATTGMIKKKKTSKKSKTKSSSKSNKGDSQA